MPESHFKKSPDLSNKKKKTPVKPEYKPPKTANLSRFNKFIIRPKETSADSRVSAAYASIGSQKSPSKSPIPTSLKSANQRNMLPFEGIKKNYSVVSFTKSKPRPINLSNVTEQIGFVKQSKQIMDSLKRKVKK